MKRLKTIIPVVLAVALLLSACKGFSFSLTTMNDKMTLEAFGAKDGSFIDSGYVGVGEGRAAVVTSSLEKGQVQIEIIEVIVFPGADIDDEDDVIEGDVAYTLTVGSDDQEKRRLYRAVHGGRGNCRQDNDQLRKGIRTQETGASLCLLFLEVEANL